MKDALPNVPVENIHQSDVPQKPKKALIIRVLVGVLIIVIISELAYLAYNNYLKPNTLNSGPILESVEESPDLTENSRDPSSPENQEAKVIEKVNDITLPLLQSSFDTISYPGIKLSNASVSFSLQGKIKEVGYEEIEIDGTKYIYFFKMVQDKSVIPVYFTQKDLISSTVTDQNKPSELLSVNDLSVGDDILLGVNINLINNPEGNSKMIIKILE